MTSQPSTQDLATKAFVAKLQSELTDAPDLNDLVARRCLFVINHSGGKDSQATTIFVKSQLPAGALVVAVHAELPEADWDGIPDHIRATIGSTPLHLCQAVWADKSGKTFLDMVADRGFWPSPTVRQCTSDLKRTPIEVVIRRLCREYNTNLVVSIDGRRAEESRDRAKLPTWTVNARLTKAASSRAPARRVYDWLPIHSWTKEQVFAAIADAGQKPHWAYQAGMSRLSCCFCVMASKSDLATAASLKPALFQRYVAMERQIGQAFVMPDNGKRVWLEELVAQVRTETDHLAQLPLAA